MAKTKEKSAESPQPSSKGKYYCVAECSLMQGDSPPKTFKAGLYYDLSDNDHKHLHRSFIPRKDWEKKLKTASVEL
jgi:hypothetical protein